MFVMSAVTHGLTCILFIFLFFINGSGGVWVFYLKEYTIENVVHILLAYFNSYKFTYFITFVFIKSIDQQKYTLFVDKFEYRMFVITLGGYCSLMNGFFFELKI